MTMYYGLINRQQALDTAIAVNNAISPKSGKNGVVMILETCAAETLLGTHKDRTDYAAGTSIAQIDESTFDWLKESYQDRSVNTQLMEDFDIDLHDVQYRELEHNPLLGMIFCRLRYLIVKDPLPTTLEGRAAYWKKWFNSYHPNAAGTPEGYIKKVAQCDVAELVERI